MTTHLWRRHHLFNQRNLDIFDSSLRMSITIRVTFATIYGIFYIPQLIVTVLFCIKKGSLILMIRTPHIYITLLGCDIASIEAENQGCVIFVEIRQSGDGVYTRYHISRVSCQKGPICHTYAWRVGPFWQETLDISYFIWIHNPIQSTWLKLSPKYTKSLYFKSVFVISLAVP